MILLIFIILNITNLFLFFKKKYKLFLFFSLLIFFVEPVFQKLSDPTLHGDTFSVFGFQRMQTNLIIITSFICILLKQNNLSLNFLPSKNIARFSRYIFFLILFQIFNVLFSENISNSVAISIVAIVGPVLFFYVVMRIPERIFMNNEALVQVISGGIICFLLIGIVMYGNTVQNLDILDDAAINRTGGGLWLSNVSTQILALLFPFVFFKINYKYAWAMKVSALILFVVLLSISMSRTGLVVYVIMLLLIFRKSRKKFLFIALGIPLLLLTLNYLGNTFQVDIIELYSVRFFGDGNAFDTTESDARFQIYNEAFEIVKGREFLGTGISTFHDLNTSGFSNAHNIFINIFVERGIIGLGFIAVFFYFMFRINVNRLINPLASNERDFFTFMKIGLLGFLLIGLTGNDLFLNSGFINGWPTYIIVFLLVIVLKKRSYLLKVKEDV